MTDAELQSVLLRERTLLDRIDAIRALHTPTMPWPPNSDGIRTLVCRACFHYVPCPTKRAADGES